MPWNTLGVIDINSQDPITSSFDLGDGTLFRFIHTKTTPNFIPGYLSIRIEYYGHGLFDYLRSYPNFNYPNLVLLPINSAIAVLGSVTRKLIVNPVGTYSVIDTGWTLRVDSFDAGS